MYKETVTQQSVWNNGSTPPKLRVDQESERVISTNMIKVNFFTL